jgi:hypothetical protein
VVQQKGQKRGREKGQKWATNLSLLTRES